MCGACYLEPNPNPFSTGIKSQKTIDLFRKKAQIVCTKHLFRHQFCVVFVCLSLHDKFSSGTFPRSPKVGHFQRAAWHGQIQLAAQLRTRPSWELHLVCGHGMISRTPWLRGYKNIVQIQKYQSIIFLGMSYFRGAFRFTKSVRMKAACTPMHFCQKSHAMPRVKRHQQAQRCHQGSCHGTSR